MRIENSKLRVEGCGLRMGYQDLRISSCHTYNVYEYLDGHYLWCERYHGGKMSG